MKKIVIACTGLLCMYIGQAQSIKVAAGKKINVVTETKSNMTMSAMGQDVDVEFTNTVTNEYEVTAVTDKGYSLRTKITRMQTANKAMGMDKSFDSDNEADRNDPMWAEVVKLLNKPSDIVIDDHLASVTSGEVMNSMAQFGLKDNTPELMKFILYKSDLDQMKVGYRWTDSIHTKDYNIVNESVVTSLSGTEAELSVKTSMIINTSMQQNGMEAKVSFHGEMTGKRYYDRVSGTLLREDSNTRMEGETEVMGQKIPMKMTGTTKLTIK